MSFTECTNEQEEKRKFHRDFSNRITSILASFDSHLLDGIWVYFGIKQFSRILFVQVERQRKRANNGVECRWLRGSKSWLEHGGCIRALVRLARKLDIFLPVRAIGSRMRGGEREVERGQGEKKDRRGEQRKKREGERGVNRDPESISRRNLK